ncbi:DUF4266 domain-containing protein [uncultured Formosa sp.]|uniref:DUF4266 domain-containing protein n=1 Tax=uncultured Formosa sp. TaxID=255435 RepID=UPI00260D819F|nr:DUF4266 domain-containing protein [uncultured Formosa sp.]
MIKKTLLIIPIIILTTSCSAVKEYEKVNINDPDMILSQRNIDRFETNFQVYREGASGANGGKSGGGCGCN